MKALARFGTVLLLLGAVLPAQKKKEPSVETKRGMEDAKPAAGATGVGAPVDPKTYKLGPEDIIRVVVWREPELSGMMMVRPDGKITMPLVGEVQASGATPDELSRQIVEALSKVMTKPEVFVQVQTVNSRRYYITGMVNKVGQFPLVTPTTVMEALSSAGGLQEYANGGKIVIVRGDQRIKFNYKEVVKGKNLKQNIYLESGDQIIVP